MREGVLAECFRALPDCRTRGWDGGFAFEGSDAKPVAGGGVNEVIATRAITAAPSSVESPGCRRQETESLPPCGPL